MCAYPYVGIGGLAPPQVSLAEAAAQEGLQALEGLASPVQQQHHVHHGEVLADQRQQRPEKPWGGGGGTTQGEGGGHLIACMDTPTKRAGRGSPGGWRGHAQQRVAGNNPKNGGGGGIGDTQRIRVNMGIPHKVKIGNRGHKKLGADLGDKKKV